jgi:hypothetical protein
MSDFFTTDFLSLFLPGNRAGHRAEALPGKDKDSRGLGAVIEPPGIFG